MPFNTRVCTDVLLRESTVRIAWLRLREHQQGSAELGLEQRLQRCALLMVFRHPFVLSRARRVETIGQEGGRERGERFVRASKDALRPGTGAVRWAGAG